MRGGTRTARLSILLLVVCFFASCQRPPSPEPGKSEDAKRFTFAARPSKPITFLSTQLNPVEEAGRMRDSILKDFPGKVDFRPNDNNYLFSQINSLLAGDPSTSILIGALQGDLAKLYDEDSLRPLEDLYGRLRQSRTFSENLMSLCRLDGKNVFIIPWMQASFVMVANRKALPYLPPGADLGSLSYQQLEQWAKNIYEKTGKRALGFPAGSKGLMHRFFQGYLYPSFTDSTLLKFRTMDARSMWVYFKDLWRFVRPTSLGYSTMAEPLLTDDVWIAWDHTARLVKAFEERPNDFVAFPAPIGPKGRGFMPVLSCLAVPKKAAGIESQSILIDYLTRPEIQNRTLNETGFFPVVNGGENGGIDPRLAGLVSAVTSQENSSASIPTLLPVGLGERGEDYNNLFMLTFSEIVLQGMDIASVLDANARELQKVLDAENARCWLPDVSGERPCKIE